MVELVVGVIKNVVIMLHAGGMRTFDAVIATGFGDA